MNWIGALKVILEARRAESVSIIIQDTDAFGVECRWSQNACARVMIGRARSVMIAPPLRAINRHEAIAQMVERAHLHVAHVLSQIEASEYMFSERAHITSLYTRLSDGAQVRFDVRDTFKMQ